MTEQHPTPWELSTHLDANDEILDADGDLICYLFDEKMGPVIVTAVNAHEELIRALAKITQRLPVTKAEQRQAIELWEQARDLLDRIDKEAKA